MRWIPVLLALAATPAMAAAQAAPPYAPQYSHPPQASQDELAAAQRALRDPSTAQAMSRVSGALTRAIMNMPVGEIEAAVEGRAPTAADRRRTVGDSVGGPQEAARIERDVASSGAQMQVMGNALANALPGMLAAAGQLQQEIERATANLPDPTYPRR